MVVLVLLTTVATTTSYAREEPVRVVVISDLNSSYGTVGYHPATHRAINQVISLKPDLVISTGDMVAGQRPNLLPAQTIDNMWQAFHDMVSVPLEATGIPLAATPGNHDASAYPRFHNERSAYHAQWTNRTAGLDFVDQAGFPFHYAVQVKGILFISLDVTKTGSLPDAQFQWLKSLVEQYQSTYSHIVLFSHVPIWPFSQGRERETTGDKRLHTLLVENGIDLYLSGHHHAFYPGMMDGVGYISQACLGSGPRRLVGATQRSARGYTVLEFSTDLIQVGGYNAGKNYQQIEWQSLPASIGNAHGRLVRADLAADGYARLE